MYMSVLVELIVELIVVVAIFVRIDDGDNSRPMVVAVVSHIDLIIVVVAQGLSL